MELSEIICVAGKSDVQCSCTNRLRLRRIGTCVLAAVTFPDSEGIAPVKSAYGCGNDHQQSCEPRRNIVQNVVELRRKTPDIRIFFVLVAYHRVHSVRGFVEKSAHRAANAHIEKGGSDAVRGVLGNCFHRRTDYAVTVKDCRIATDYHRNRFTGSLSIAALSRFAHLHTLVPQASRCKHITAQYRFNSNAEE